MDYRNGVHDLDWDPTKWLIWLSAKTGLAWDLKLTSENEIKKGIIAPYKTYLHLNWSILAKLLTLEAKLNKEREAITFEPRDDTLPVLSISSISKYLSHDSWTIIDGYVLDIGSFISQHPGGEGLLRGQLGKDATKSFYGNLNNHSRSARQLMKMLRVARIEGGSVADVLRSDSSVSLDALELKKDL